MPVLTIAAVLMAAYLIGSISFAWLVARAHGVNLRKVGSGNLGATNVGRSLGGTWFAVVFLLDVAKGAVPVLGAGLVPEAPFWLPVAAGACAVIGHVLPLYHGLRGGKAVATSLGVVVALAPLPAAIAAAVWLVVWIIGWAACGQKKDEAVGLASVLGAITAPIAHLLLKEDPWSRSQSPVSGLLLLLGFVIVIRHRSNLRQLLRGSDGHRTDTQPTQGD